MNTQQDDKTKRTAETLPGAENTLRVGDGNKITLVGPSLSGKTHMLAAIASAESVADDTEIGPDKVIKCQINFETLQEDAASKAKINALRNDYDAILSARSSEATRKLFNYTVGFAYEEPMSTDVETQPATTKESRKERIAREVREKAAASAPLKTKNRMSLFHLVDGRGGDLTKKQHEDEVDEDTQKFIDDHYEALRSARGAIICLPWHDNSTIQKNDSDALMDRDVNGLEDLLKEFRFAQNSRLEHIAVCVTQYELAFMDDGVNAHSKATNRDHAHKLLRETGYGDLFKALRGYLMKLPAGRKTKVRVFPCSTYGFVNGRGASNFYPSKKCAGLLTRSLSVQDWESSPDLKNHFPKPISDVKASKMWHPFNLGSPLFFAATGKVTGPMSFSLEEVL